MPIPSTSPAASGLPSSQTSQGLWDAEATQGEQVHADTYKVIQQSYFLPPALQSCDQSDPALIDVVGGGYKGHGGVGAGVMGAGKAEEMKVCFGP